MPAKLVRRLKTYFVSRRDLHNCRIYRSTDQNIGNSAWTTISFDNERFDTSPNDDIWAIGQPTRLTCRRAGKYPIVADVAFESDPTGDRRARIRLNGAIVIGQVNVKAAVNGRTIICVAPPPYQLAVGDFVELQAWQDSGGALDVDNLAQYSPEFGMARVG